MTKSIRTRALVVVVAGILGLLAAEISVRVLRIGPIPAPSEVGEVARFCDDPDIRVELIPGATMRTQFKNRQGEVEREALHVVNSQGFRGATVEKPKPADTFRIVCLGDSQTFGNGVSEGESWPAAFDAELAAHP